MRAALGRPFTSPHGADASRAQPRWGRPPTPEPLSMGTVVATRDITLKEIQQNEKVNLRLMGGEPGRDFCTHGHSGNLTRLGSVVQTKHQPLAQTISAQRHRSLNPLPGEVERHAPQLKERPRKTLQYQTPAE